MGSFKNNFFITLGCIVTGALFFMYTKAAQDSGQIELRISEGTSCCTYGESINFGNKHISFTGYEFSGDFLSTIGTPVWTCTDMQGIETGRTMVVQMGSPLQSESNNIIPSSNVKLSYGTTTMVGGSCVPYIHSGNDVSLDNPVIILEKDGNMSSNYGKICALQTSAVKMKVVIDPAQAPGTYTGTVVIDIPGFMSSCNANQLLQGTIYDSEIDGLYYIGSLGSSGITADGGKFTYKSGERVTFYVGSGLLGSVVPELDKKVFLPELFGKERSNIVTSDVIKTARILQGLDQDNNPNNGITIVAGDVSTISGSLTGLEMQEKLVELSKPIKSSVEVAQHLEQTLNTNFQESGNIVYPWAVKGGSVSNDMPYKEAIDMQGNVYVVGYFQGTATFGSTTLVSSGGVGDTLISKVDPQGNWLRSVKGGGVSNDWIQSIDIDNSGYIYVGGANTYTGTYGSFTIKTNATTAGFIAKLDGSGNWLNAIPIASGIANSNVQGIKVDSQGNTYVIGLFAGVETTFGGNSLVSSGGKDIFVAKLDKDRNWVWVKKMGGTLDDNVRADPVIDELGNVYIGGIFSGTMSYAGTTVVASGNDSFVAKLDSNGNGLWIKYITGSKMETLYTMKIDQSQNVYVGGYYTSAPLQIDGLSLYNSGLYDMFLLKFATNGTLLWGRRGGGAGNDMLSLIVFNSGSNIYMGGPAAAGTYGPYSIGNGGGYDLMLGEIDPSGNWLGAWKRGSGSNEYVRGLVIDSGYNLYIAGYADGATTLGQNSLSNSGGSDIFVKKVLYRELY